MLSERCWSERRRSSVRLKIDDRVFSWCHWQRTRSLCYLTITQSLSISRCLEDGSSWRTDARRRSSVNCRRYVFRTVTSVFVSTGLRAVPVIVNMVGTRHRRPRSRQLFTGKFQLSSMWLRRSTVVRGRANRLPARSSLGRRCSDILPSSSSDVALVDTIAGTISASQWSGRRSPSPLLDATCSSPSSRNVRSRMLICALPLCIALCLLLLCPFPPFPFSPRISR